MTLSQLDIETASRPDHVIDPGPVSKSRDYRITTRTRTGIRSGSSESESVTIVRKEFVEHGDDGMIFRLRMLGHTRSHGKEMIPLFRHTMDELRMLTNPQGHIVEFLGLDEVEARWFRMRDMIESELESTRPNLARGMERMFEDRSRLESSLRAMPMISMLFPDVYGKISAEGRQPSDPRLLCHLMDVPLPLKCTRSVVPGTSDSDDLTVSFSGQLDRDAMDEKRVRQTGKKLVGDVRAKIHAMVESDETFVVGKNGWLKSGTQQIIGIIPSGWLVESNSTLEKHTSN